MTRLLSPQLVRTVASDASLLGQFVRDRDETAFAELVRRYGSLVLGVCRRVIPDRHLAEDAFQAAFVVLARKAESVRPADNLASWLYGVAFKVALRARTMTGRRAKRETLTNKVPETPVHQNQPDDSVAILDEAISELPALYREAVVLCELQGATRRDAAKQLGIQEGTLSSRLAKARKLLAENLSKRGLALPAVLTASAIITPTLFAATVQCATGIPPRAVTALADGVTRIMLLSKLKITVGLALVVVLSLGFGMDGFSNPVSLTAAPVPKAEKDEGVVWTYNWQTGQLLAYRPNGDKLKEYKLPYQSRFHGVTPDGKKFMYAAEPGGKVPDKPNFAEGKLTLHTRDVGDESEATDLGIEEKVGDRIVWSPDGGKFFRYRRMDGAKPIYVACVFDKKGKEVKTLEFRDNWPIGWAADGKGLTISTSHSGTPPKNVTVSRVSIADEKTEKLFEGEYLDDPHVAPDGKALLSFNNFAPQPDPDPDKPNKGVLVTDLATGKIKTVAKREKQGYATGQWSPDSQRIAYRWCEIKPTNNGVIDGDWHIVVSDADGKNEFTLFTDPMSPTAMSTNVIGWTPTPLDLKNVKSDATKITAPIPKEKPLEWKEAKPIELDGGRITSVAYTPDGKTFAVCRADGKIDFFDAETRKLNKSIAVKTDPANENTEVGTVTAIAFGPTPHKKMGDIFAVTHKNGIVFGSMDTGLLADVHVKVIAEQPDQWEMKGFDPHRVAWLSDNSLVATNGEEVAWRLKGGTNIVTKQPGGKRGQPTLLAPLPGQSQFFLTSGSTEKEVNEVHIVAAPPMSSPQTRLVGHKSRPTAAVVSKDGKCIVSLDEGGTIIVWEGYKFDFLEKSRIEQGPGTVALAFAPDGKTLAVLRTNGIKLLGAFGGSGTQFDLFVFDPTDPPAKPEPIWTTANPIFGKFTGPASLAFSPDGKTLLAAFGDPFPDPDAKLAKSLGVRVWELGMKITAPVPKEKPEGLIWIADHSAKKLQAFKPDGTVEKEISIPWHGQYLGLTPFGKIALAGKKGKIIEEEKLEGLTLHLRAFEEKAEAVDTGIPYSIGDGVLWSPDGKQLIRIRIVANNAARNGSTEFTHTLIDVETKKEKGLELPKYHRVCAWSPDGTWWLVTESEGDSCRLHRFPVNGDKPTKLSDDYRYFLTGAISPDGKSVAGFAAGKYNAETETSVFAVPSDFGKTLIISKNPKALSSNGTWSLDGKRIACLTVEEHEDAPRNKLSVKKLTICDADGSNAKVLKEWKQAEVGDTDFNRTFTCNWLGK